MQDMSIAELCREVREKSGVGGADHGIFQPPVEGVRTGRWLSMDRTVQYYDLISDMEIHYKKKHRPLKIRLLDGTVKTVLVDDSAPVAEITENIAEKLSIQNPEEFSIAREADDGPLSKEKEKKLKKGKHVEDDTSWLNPSLSLHENGVDESMVVSFKKKFFYNDANIDRSDPIQLHLMYVQTRDAILEGKYPTSKNEALNLAALQLQVQFGNHSPTKHKIGFFKVKEFFAPQWHKVKNIEKAAIAEYRKLVGMTEENGKYRYLQLCRSLKTYGITTYAVTRIIKIGEAKPGKKQKGKMVPVLLGVTRDSIVMMDPTSRAVLKTHMLTTVRRFAASPESFTLDLGNYEDAYQTFKTKEGEAITQLIAGYIDIILKKRKDASAMIVEDDGETAVEEVVAPIRAVAVSTTTSNIGIRQLEQHHAKAQMIRPAAQARSVATVTKGHYQGPNADTEAAGKHGVDGGFMPINDLPSALDAMDLMLDDMDNFEPMDDDGQFGADDLLATLTKLGQGATQLMNGDRKGTDAAAKQIGQNIGAMLQAARRLASKSEDDISLLTGARKVSESIADILRVAKDGKTNGIEMANAQRALQASIQHMNMAQQGTLVPQHTQDLMLETARMVASDATAMAARAFAMARQVGGDDAKRLVQETKDAAALAHLLSKTASSFSGVISDPAMRAHMAKLIGDVRNSSDLLVTSFKTAGVNQNALKGLLGAGDRVLKSLQMLQHAMAAGAMATSSSGLSAAGLDMLQGGTDLEASIGRLLEVSVPEPDMLRTEMRTIAGATKVTLDACKIEAQSSNDDTRRKLLLAAKNLAQATAKLVGSAKTLADTPNDPTYLDDLKHQAGVLSESVVGVVGNIQRKDALEKLYARIQTTSAHTTALCTQAKVASSKTSNAGYRAGLLKSSQAAMDAVAGLVEVLSRSVEENNGEYDPQMVAELLQGTQMVAQRPADFVALALRSAPTVTDPQIRDQLAAAANRLGASVHEMVAAMHAMQRHHGSKESREAASELEAALAEASASVLKVAGGAPSSSSSSACAADAADARAMVRMSGTQLLVDLEKIEDQSQNPENAKVIGKSLLKLARDIGQTAHASRLLVNSTMSKPLALRTAEESKNLAEKALLVAHASSFWSFKPESAEKRADLLSSACGLRDALNGLLTAASGVDTDRLEYVVKELEQLQVEGDTRSSDQEKPDAKESARLLVIAARTAASASDMVIDACRNDVSKLTVACTMMMDAAGPLARAGYSSAKAQADPKERNVQKAKVVGALACMTQLVKEAMTVVQENQKNQTGESAQLCLADASMPRTVQSYDETKESLQDLQASASATMRMMTRAIDTLNRAKVAMDTEYVLFTEPAADAPTDGMSGKEYTKVGLLSAWSTKLAGLLPRMVGSRGDTEKLAGVAKDMAGAVAQLLSVIGLDMNAASGENLEKAQSELCVLADRLLSVLKSTRENLESRSAYIACAKACATDYKALRSHVTTLGGSGKLDAATKAELIQRFKSGAQATAAVVQAAKAFPTLSNGEKDAPLVELVEILGVIVGIDTKYGVNPKSASGGSSANAKTTMSGRSTKFVSNTKMLRQPLDETVSQLQLLMNAASLVIASPNDVKALGQFGALGNNVGETLQALVVACNDMVPGAKETRSALATMNEAVAELDEAALSVAVGGKVEFTAVHELDIELENPLATHHDHQEGVVDAARALAKVVPLWLNGKKKKESVVSCVVDLDRQTRVLKLAALGTASTTSDGGVAGQVVGHAKDICEALHAMLDCPDTENEENAELEERVRTVVGSIGVLVKSLRGGVVALRDIDDAAELIEQARATVANPLDSDAPNAESLLGQNYFTAKADMNTQAQDLVKSLRKLVTSAKSDMTGLGDASKDSGLAIQNLIAVARSTARFTSEPKSRQHFLDSATQIAESVAGLLRSAKDVAVNQKDTKAIRALAMSFKKTTTALSGLVGTTTDAEKMIKADMDALEEYYQDLDSTLIFCGAGEPIELVHEVDAARNAKLTAAQVAGLDDCALVENVPIEKSEEDLIRLGTFVQESSLLGKNAVFAETCAENVASAVRADVETMAKNIRTCKRRVGRLSHRAKFASASIPDANAKVSLLTFSKDLCKSLADLCSACLTAQKTPDDEDAASAVVMSTSAVALMVQGLVKEMDKIRLKSAAGIVALEKAAAAMIYRTTPGVDLDAEDRGSLSSDKDAGACCGEGARDGAKAIGLVVSAFGAAKKLSDDQSLGSAQSAASSDAVVANTVAAANAMDDSHRRIIMASRYLSGDKALGDACAKVSDAFVDLVETSAHISPTNEGERVMGEKASLATSVLKNLVRHVKTLAGGENASLDDEMDANLKIEEEAQKELLAAVQAIEKAAAMLSSFKPAADRVRDPSGQINTEDVAEAITEGVGACAVATASLVRAAAVCQAERVARGTNAKTKHLYRADPTWANGLMSAAKNVAASTQQMVRSASEAVTSKGDPEKVDLLMACAQTVGATTAHLVAAQRAKAEQGSRSQDGLMSASKSVTRATQALVSGIKGILEQKKEAEEVAAQQDEDYSMSSTMREEMEARARILKLQRELEDAQKAQRSMRKAQYK